MSSRMQRPLKLKLVVAGWQPPIQTLALLNDDVLHIIVRHNNIMLIQPDAISNILESEPITAVESKFSLMLKKELSTCSPLLIRGSEKYIWIYDPESSNLISIGFENLNISNVISRQRSFYFEPSISRILCKDRISRISTGFNHTLMLTTHGQVLATGAGSNGELGIGKKLAWSSELLLLDFRVEDSAREKCSIAWDVCAGCSISAVIWGSSRNLFTFGSGAYYRLGHGNEEDCTVPTLVSSLEGVGILNDDGTSGGIAMVTCSTWHMVAVAVGSNDVFAWGWNKFGQVKARESFQPHAISSDNHAESATTQGVIAIPPELPLSPLNVAKAAQSYHSHDDKSGSVKRFYGSGRSEIVRYPRRLSELDSKHLVGEDGAVLSVTCGSKHTALLVQLSAAMAPESTSAAAGGRPGDDGFAGDSDSSAHTERVIVMGQLGVGSCLGIHDDDIVDSTTTDPRVVFDAACPFSSLGYVEMEMKRSTSAGANDKPVQRSSSTKHDEQSLGAAIQGEGEATGEKSRGGEDGNNARPDPGIRLDVFVAVPIKAKAAVAAAAVMTAAIVPPGLATRSRVDMGEGIGLPVGGAVSWSRTGAAAASCDGEETGEQDCKRVMLRRADGHKEISDISGAASMPAKRALSLPPPARDNDRDSYSWFATPLTCAQFETPEVEGAEKKASATATTTVTATAAGGGTGFQDRSSQAKRKDIDSTSSRQTLSAQESSSFIDEANVSVATSAADSCVQSSNQRVISRRVISMTSSDWTLVLLIAES